MRLILRHPTKIVQSYIDKGTRLRKKEQWDNALTCYQQALDASRKLKDKVGEGRSLDFIGIIYLETKRYKDAFEIFSKALIINRQTHDTQGEAWTLSDIGRCHANLNNQSKALEYSKQALPLFRTVYDNEGEANMYYQIGRIHDNASDHQNALQYFFKALPLYRKIKNNRYIGNTILYIGTIFSSLKDIKNALTYYNESIHYFEASNHSLGKANALYDIGLIYKSNSDERASSYFLDALSLYISIKNNKYAGETLIHLGTIYRTNGDFNSALEYYKKANSYFESAQYVKGNADFFYNSGLVYEEKKDYSAALSSLMKALVLYKSINASKNITDSLYNIGCQYDNMWNKSRALEYYEQALITSRKTQYKSREAILLKSIGSVNNDLGNNEKSIEYYLKALNIQKELNKIDEQASTLQHIGVSYNDMGKSDKALEYYNSAITLYEKAKDDNGKAYSLQGIGLVFDNSNKKQDALAYYEKALKLFSETSDEEGKASGLALIGSIYLEMGRFDECLTYNNSALFIQRKIKDIQFEAITLNNLMLLFDNPKYSEHSPRIAALYGKQSVNIYQNLRKEARKVSKDSLKSFTKSVESTYRDLTDVLISQGRLPEAQQVLALLKEQELFDFVRRDATTTGVAGELALTPKETEIEQRYQEIGDQLTALGARQAKLNAKRQRTEAEEKERAQLTRDLEVASARFQAFLAGIRKELEQAPVAQLQLAALNDAETLTRTLSDLTRATRKNNVAVFTLVVEQKLRFIVVTPNTQLSREVPIRASELSQLIAQFRAALENPSLDPRPLGKKLYDILIKPIEKDLTGAEAASVYWSLDGALRYLPLAALSPDGKSYLVESKTLHSVFSTRVKERLLGNNDEDWHALGLGVSKGATVNGVRFAPLPAAAAEVQEITKSLDGKSLLDEAFTKEAMLSALDGSFPVVHIASHFQFQPGNETRSYLLLGNGATLSLSELRQLPASFFNGVVLLTLSACNTAMGGGDSAGAEVESFALLMQLKGAGAVLASLWPVADSSTQQLMQAFYATRKATPTLSKSECLRQAQLGLLTGSIKPELTTRGPVVATGAKAPTTIPAFTADPSAPCAHPYYWAPFILIGNTR